MTGARSRITRISATTALAAALLCAAPAAALAQAATDYYLKIEGIEGESAARGQGASGSVHTGEIEILSWSWGATNSGSAHVGGGMGAGKANVQDISLMSSSSSPPGTGAPDSADARKRPGKVKYGDITMKKGAGSGGGAGGVAVAAGDVDGDGRAEVAAPRDSASGLATGRRQHQPAGLASPLPSGSVTLVGRFGGACVAGTHFPKVEIGMRRGGAPYVLSDAVVTGCTATTAADGRPMQSLSMNYTKISF